MKKTCYILLIMLFFLNGCSRYEKIKGMHVILQDPEIRQRYGGEMGALADELKEAGVNLVITPVMENGTAFYPSDILPQRREDGTQLLAFRHELRRRNIRFAAYIPVFTDAYSYYYQPSLRAVDDFGSRTNQEHMYAVCPGDPEYRDYKREAVREVLLILQPDMLYFDDLSFPLDKDILCNGKISASQHQRSYCFCPDCRKAFSEFSSIAIPSHLSTPEAAAWILENHEDEWIRWKCDLITSYVKELKNNTRDIMPDCKIMLVTFAREEAEHHYDRQRLAGHNLKDLNDYVDYFVSPPCPLLNEEDYSRLAELRPGPENPKKHIIPSLKLSAGHKSENRFRQSLNFFKNRFILYSWTSLLKNRSYLNIYSTEF